MQQCPRPTDLSPQHLRRRPAAAAGAASGGDCSQDTGPRQVGLDGYGTIPRIPHSEAAHHTGSPERRELPYTLGPYTLGPSGPPLPRTRL